MLTVDYETAPPAAKYVGLAFATGLGIAGTVTVTKATDERGQYKLTKTGWRVGVLIIVSSLVGALGQYAGDSAKRLSDKKANRERGVQLTKLIDITESLTRVRYPLSKIVGVKVIYSLPFTDPVVQQLRTRHPDAFPRSYWPPTEHDLSIARAADDIARAMHVRVIVHTSAEPHSTQGLYLDMPDAALQPECDSQTKYDCRWITYDDNQKVLRVYEYARTGTRAFPSMLDLGNKNVEIDVPSIRPVSSLRLEGMVLIDNDTGMKLNLVPVLGEVKLRK